MTKEDVRNYIDDEIDLDDYDLDGVEISDEDCEEIAEKVNSGNYELSDAVDEVFEGIREILDEGLDEVDDGIE